MIVGELFIGIATVQNHYEKSIDVKKQLYNYKLYIEILFIFNVLLCKCKTVFSITQ